MGLKKWFISFALQGASISIFNIVLSLYVVIALKGNIQSASVAVAFFSLGNLIGSISSSIILDKIRKVSLLIYLSFLSSSLIIILMAFVKSIYLYYLLSTSLGIMISFTGPAMTLQLSKAGDDGFVRRQINNLNLYNSIGSTIGMLFGSFLLNTIKNLDDVKKLKIVFFISSILLLISSVLTLERRKIVIRIVPDIRATKIIFLKAAKFTWEFFSVINIKKLDRQLRLLIFAIFIIFFGANLLFTIFAVFLKEYFKVSSQFVFFLFAANSLGGNIAFFIVRQTSKNKQLDKIFIEGVLITRSIIFLLIGIFLFLKVGFVKLFTYIGFIVLGFTWPFLYIPLTLQITNLTSHETRGKTLGMFNMAINFGVITASFVAGFISYHLGYALLFIIGGFFVFLGYLLMQRTLT